MVARRGHPSRFCANGGETSKQRGCKVQKTAILRRGVGMAQVIHGEFGAGVEPADATANVMASVPGKIHSVAALNLGPKPGDVGGNLLLADRAIVEARLAHLDLGWVVLPELFTTGYSNLAAIHRYAEDAG